jgi:hypothetical protein
MKLGTALLGSLIVLPFLGLALAARAAEEPRVVNPGPPLGDARWDVGDGVATVRGGDIITKKPFGDCQLHIEWATPAEVKGDGQGRGEL